MDVRTEKNCLLGLIDEYWSIAYQEGLENRTYDTEDWKAQHCRYLIEKAVDRLAKAAER